VKSTEQKEEKKEDVISLWIPGLMSIQIDFILFLALGFFEFFGFCIYAKEILLKYFVAQ
jgi:hypothetical protein